MRKRKATDRSIDNDFLNNRFQISQEKGYTKQKWIVFCETLLEKGFTLSLYEARRTVSKYITIRRGEKSFKVRFSNHKPIKDREIAGDCDFFVGKTHLGCTTTDQALAATLKHFEENKQ